MTYGIYSRFQGNRSPLVMLHICLSFLDHSHYQSTLIQLTCFTLIACFLSGIIKYLFFSWQLVLFLAVFFFFVGVFFLFFLFFFSIFYSFLLMPAFSSIFIFLIYLSCTFVDFLQYFYLHNSYMYIAFGKKYINSCRKESSKIQSSWNRHPHHLGVVLPFISWCIHILYAVLKCTKLQLTVFWHTFTFPEK